VLERPEDEHQFARGVRDVAAVYQSLMAICGAWTPGMNCVWSARATRRLRKDAIPTIRFAEHAGSDHRNHRKRRSIVTNANVLISYGFVPADLNHVARAGMLSARANPPGKALSERFEFRLKGLFPLAWTFPSS
jgi:hypothetical protein